MSERDVIIGNLTTIIMFVFSTIGGGAIVNWLGGTSQATIFIGACCGLIYSIINAYFPNYLKFLNNNKEDIENIANCVCNKEECGGVEEVEDSIESDETFEDIEDEII